MSNSDVDITGTITYRQHYRGGAAPPPQLLEQLQQPKPFADAVFFVRAGATNDVSQPVVATFHTDAEGRFKVKLPKGQVRGTAHAPKTKG